MHGYSFVFLLVLLSSLFCFSRAGEITPTDDLSEALTNAGAGDTFSLTPGIHNISVTANITTTVNIEGEPGSPCIISCLNPIVAFNILGDPAILVTVDNVQFWNCGTAILLGNTSDLKVTRSVFTHSSNTAISAINSGFVNIANCTFNENVGTSDYNAGAINAEHTATVTILDSLFFSNVGYRGGAIYAHYNLFCNLTNTHGTNNSATDSGGFAHISTTTAVFKDVTLSQNSVLNGAGGGVFLDDSYFSSYFCIFEHNSKGAIYSSSPTGKNMTIDSSIFTGNSAPGFYSGAIYAQCPTQINNCSFTSNTAALGGALYLVTNASVDSCTFTNNSAQQGGGAIGTTSNSNVTFTNSIFTGNYAQNSGGGAIYATNVFTASSCSFTNNTSDTLGGAAYFTLSYVRLSLCTFTKNSARGGGALYFNMAYLTTITSSVFDSNTSPSDSGAGIALLHTYLTMQNSTFVSGAALKGGGIYASQSVLNCTNTTFSTNSAYVGGGVCLEQFTTFSGASTHFYGNHAAQGGGMYLSNSSVTTTNAEFSGNSAAFGGGVYALQSNTTFDTPRFILNSASRGGGVFASYGSLNLFVPDVESNSANETGGGVHVEFAMVDIQAGRIQTNEAPIGGGVYHFGAPDGNLSLISVLVQGNSATQGGGLYLAAAANVFAVNCTGNSAGSTGGCAAVYDAQAQFTKCYVSTNTAPYGGGIGIVGYVRRADVTVTNSSIFGNLAMTRGAGLDATSANLEIVEFSSIYNNTCLSSGGAISLTDTSLYINSSKIEGNYAYGNGGGISSIKSMSILQQISIHNNSANLYGGGYYASQSALFSTLSEFVGNNAIHGGGLYFASGSNYTLLINNTITENFANLTESAIYIPGETNQITIRDTLLSTSPSISTFCCEGYPLHSVEKLVCSYPTCDKNCKEAKQCQCPFSFPTPQQESLDTTTQNLPDYNSTCSCLGGFYGPTCQYTKSPGSSDEPDLCSLNNGGCDPRVNCTQSDLGPSCGRCPLGTFGTGRACVTYCGDGVCAPFLGEDCVSCRKDCVNASCGKCGDGKCDSGETCTSCYEDCLSLCPIQKCPGCSAHGTCINGICVCQGSYSGPDCSESTVPIDVNTNSSTPTVEISTQNVQFSIGVRKLVEKNSQHTIVDEIDLDSREHNFSYVKSVFSNSSKNTMWEYSTVLSNFAVTNITFISFEDPTTQYTFEHVNTSFPAHTLKFNLRVANWPFKNIQNTLEAVMETVATSNVPCDARFSTKQDSGGSVAWIKVTLNGFSAYGQFQPQASIDGVSRKIIFELNNDDTISAVLPHFWEVAEFDPSFSVLVGDGSSGKVDECGNPIKSHSIKKTVAIAVPVAIIGAALLAGIVILLLKRRHERNNRKKWKNIKMQQKESSDSELIHERAKDMEVNTAAGRFVVPM
eukprot:Phypoly_transcript_00637.p1 GENE.Phypoly_transcript_00637~~Phypoly_transcript_00637.p1  ORF type:complete len:1406 (+),score=212.85 Phypoly_transcript_00637:35-4252(+)